LELRHQIVERAWTERLARRWPEIVLVLTVLCFYARTVRYDFTYWDDVHYIVQTPHLHAVTAGNLKRVFAPGAVPDENLYIPLTYLSYMLDIGLFGLQPGGLHFTNTILHLANVLLVFVLFGRLCGSRRAAFFTALLTAVHPLQAEAAVWLLGRKDLLSTTFALLSLLAYGSYAASGRRRRYWAAFALYICALLAKPSTIVLPALLVLVAAYPSGRLRLKDVLVQAPFAVVAVACLALQPKTDPAVGQLVGSGTLVRCLYVPYVMQGWLQRLCLVSRPAVFYSWYAACDPRHVSLSAYALCLGLAGVTGFALHRRLKEAWFGLLFFAIGFLPAVGLMSYTYREFITADRYGYFPLIGLFFLVSWFGWRAVEGGNRIAAGALAAWLCAAACLGFAQIGVWRDAEALWTHVIARDPDNYLAHYNLGNHYYRQGRRDLAVRRYFASVAILPVPEAYYNLGVTLSELGNQSAALASLRRALALRPGYEVARRRLESISSAPPAQAPTDPGAP